MEPAFFDTGAATSLIYVFGLSKARGVGSWVGGGGAAQGGSWQGGRQGIPVRSKRERTANLQYVNTLQFVQKYVGGRQIIFNRRSFFDRVTCL
jgi:hypothetical protein